MANGERVAYTFNGEPVLVREMSEILGCKETATRKYASASSGEYQDIVAHWRSVPAPKMGRPAGVKNNEVGAKEWKALGVDIRVNRFTMPTKWEKELWPDKPEWPAYDPALA